jgi:hypothetical protein
MNHRRQIALRYQKRIVGDELLIDSSTRSNLSPVVISEKKSAVYLRAVYLRQFVVIFFDSQSEMNRRR